MNNRLNNIFFLGGIHGAGKTTLGRILADNLGIEYLSASKLIKWNENNTVEQNKKVFNIAETQNLLLNKLYKQVDPQKLYILDGHYCLINRLSQTEQIPEYIFKEINPICFILINESLKTIKRRLISRNYNQEFIETVYELSKHELKYANELSKRLNKGLIVSNSKDISIIQNYLAIKISSMNI